MRAIAILMCLLLPYASIAGADTAKFDITVAGVRAGSMTIKSEENGGIYKVNASARSSGIAAAFMDLWADGAVNGRVSGNKYRPSVFVEQVKGRKGLKKRTFKYNANGVPSITHDPARKPGKRRDYHASPSAQAGTLDPLTAAYAILRNRPASTTCDLDINLFDGERRSRLRFVKSEPKKGGLLCHGIYTRVDGFSPKERKEKQDWPFQVTYAAPRNGTMQVDLVRIPTTFGSVLFRRK